MFLYLHMSYFMFPDLAYIHALVFPLATYMPPVLIFISYPCHMIQFTCFSYLFQLFHIMLFHFCFPVFDFYHILRLVVRARSRRLCRLGLVVELAGWWSSFGLEVDLPSFLCCSFLWRSCCSSLVIAFGFLVVGTRWCILWTFVIDGSVLRTLIFHMVMVMYLIAYFSRVCCSFSVYCSHEFILDYQLLSILRVSQTQIWGCNRVLSSAYMISDSNNLT